MGWIIFTVIISIALAVDLGLFQKNRETLKVREALVWTIIWVLLALVFCVWIYFVKGSEAAIQFLTGYLIEKSLSVDNLFVFLLIFSYFHVDRIYQKKILTWGIIGAMLMRVVFIFGGIALIHRFAWIPFIFSAILIFTGIRLAFQKDKKLDPEKNIIMRLTRKVFRVAEQNEDGRFFVRKSGKLYATPLFAVLVFVEATDVIFAVDSIPAIFAITLDPFIVFTSNIFAVMGLRSLFFVLSGALQAFEHLHVGLALILVFVGSKMAAAHHLKIPPLLSLLVILGILICSIAASLLWPKNKKNLD